MKFLSLLAAEMLRQSTLLVRYPLELFVSIALFVLLFYGFVQGAAFVSGGGGEMPSALLRVSLIGYLCWLYAIGAVAFVATEIQNESEVGLIENTFYTSYAIEILYIARIVANLALGLISFLPMAFLLTWLLDIDLNLQWSSLLPGLLLVVASLGIGFMYGGIALLFKKVQLLLMPILLGALALFTIPTAAFTGNMVLVKTIIPGLPAVDTIRRLSNGEELSSLTSLILISGLNAVVFFSAGLWVFMICKRSARRKGTIGQY